MTFQNKKLKNNNFDKNKQIEKNLRIIGTNFNRMEKYF